MVVVNSVCGGSVMAVTCWPSRRVTCLASSNPVSGTDLLRSQLDQLHSEADSVRAKANNARMRLMRLSETAGNLKRQAAISVRTGKEDEARELLFQKKKVMEALDKSKARIELLDELSSKLQEAISLKERQLIGNVALDLGVSREDSSSSVRIVSPVPGVTESDELGSNDDRKSEGDREIESSADRRESLHVDLERDDTSSIDEGVNGFERITSFRGLLENMDEQLTRIEEELVTVVRVSSLLLSGEEKLKNFKVQQTMELLESVRGIRNRFTSIEILTWWRRFTARGIICSI